jgi:hypothetical protein
MYVYSKEDIEKRSYKKYKYKHYKTINKHEEPYITIEDIFYMTLSIIGFSILLIMVVEYLY